MRFGLGKLAAKGLALAASLWAGHASAFGGSNTYELYSVPVPGVNATCQNAWEIFYYKDGDSAFPGNEAYIAFLSGGLGSTAFAGGSGWFLGNYVTASRPPITAAAIDASCASLSNVVIISQDGIDPANAGSEGSTATNAQFAGESYIGVIYEADHTDGNRYRYELALSGLTNTSLINTRTIVAANTTPVADAGTNQTLAPGALVTLDGSGSSDADGDPLTYAWSQTSGPTVTLSSTTAQMPTFTAPATDAQSLIFTLVVNDTMDNSVGSSVIITTAAAQNTAPTADAGSPQIVASAAAVSLDGSGSTDPEPGQPLTYAWTQTAGTTVALSSTTAASPTLPPRRFSRLTRQRHSHSRSSLMTALVHPLRIP